MNNPIEFLREVIRKRDAAGPTDDRDATLGVLTAVMETLVDNKVEIALALLAEAGATVCKAGHISSHHSNVKGELEHNFDVYESERDAHRRNKVGTINPGDTVIIIPAERRGGK